MVAESDRAGRLPLAAAQTPGPDGPTQVRFANYSTITGSQTLTQPMGITQELWQAIDRLFRENFPAGHPAVRLLGTGCRSVRRHGFWSSRCCSIKRTGRSKAE